MNDLGEPRRTSGWTPLLTAFDLLRQFIGDARAVELKRQVELVAQADHTR